MQNAIVLVTGLSLVGLLLRVKIKFLQTYYIPAAIAGGLLGLLGGPFVLGLIPEAIILELRGWPGVLIAVIFAGLFLDGAGHSLRESAKRVARQGVVVWIIILGEITVGLLVTWLVLLRFFDIPDYFGQVIEIGFAGGHGTAAAMGEFYAGLGFAEGTDIGFFVATVGLIYGVVSGIVLVNLGVRRGWTRSKEVQVSRLTGLEPRHKPQPIMYGKVLPEVLDPLAFQLLILLTAFGLGVGLYQLASWLVPFLGKFPLFIFTLMAGLLLRNIMRLLKIDDLIDPGGIKRLMGTAMELLIVAAITSLNLTVVLNLLIPVSVILLVAFCWTVVCLLVVGRLLLPADYWFELGIINYGMSTGTTAVGLMLLRIIDKDLESGAAEDYAMAAPLSAPFIGGGIITFLIPVAVINLGPGMVVGGLILGMLLLFGIGLKLRDPVG